MMKKLIVGQNDKKSEVIKEMLKSKADFLKKNVFLCKNIKLNDKIKERLIKHNIFYLIFIYLYLRT
ncbi:hypothetical protein BpHYR1_032309 [Brachionus plicatilis]|uniref:Uncharacterized protein n=1 Tax=Brachionus plicatilis TaxID=10195 RepID=A0A3M7Q6L3_BRAPC|nr:hypothetical protein BpHYR1_032309 [Brachionus plicatilis]